MKKASLTLFLLIFGISSVRADTIHAIVGGVIRSVSWADQARGTKSEIVVLDSARNKVNILVAPTTTLWDADAKAIMLESLIPKERVNVIYLTTDEGINVGKSIKILK